jgi:hypothetical protein
MLGLKNGSLLLSIAGAALIVWLIQRRQHSVGGA